MDTLKAYMLQKALKRYQKLDDKLTMIESIIDWEAFRPIIQSHYHNKSSKGGRPNIEVIVVKLLVLQQ